MANWPSITDDDQTGLTGTIFNKAFFDLIKAFVQAGSHQSGLDTNKPAECSPGDVYHATDTETYYICFVANVWSGVGGGAAAEQVRLPDPEAGDFATPSVYNQSSEMSDDILGPAGNTDRGLNSTGNVRQAQKITLSGKTLQKVGFYVQKGNGSPTGTAYARVRRVSDDGIIETSSTTLDVATLTVTPEWKEFVFTCAPNEAVRISLEYDGGDGNNFIRAWYSSSDVITGECATYYEGEWTDRPTEDASIRIYFPSSPATNTVDEDTATNWNPDPINEAGAWISWDIGSLKFVGGCRIYWGSEAAYRPTEYKLYVSANGTDWTEVIHETEAAPASAWKTYQWYVRYVRYFKLVVTTHGASGTKVYEVDEYSTNQDGVILTHGHGGLS